ncbi:hypothetical protein ES708_10764 [subsurface metagenome]
MVFNNSSPVIVLGYVSKSYNHSSNPLYFIFLKDFLLNSIIPFSFKISFSASPIFSIQYSDFNIHPSTFGAHTGDCIVFFIISQIL